MPAIGRQKIDPLLMVVIAVFAAAMTALAIGMPELMLFVILAMVVLVLAIQWSLRWEVTAWTWIWVLSYGLLGRGFWRLEIAGFFNMTIPRFIFIAAAVIFTLHFLLRRGRILCDRYVLLAMGLLLMYCAGNASAFGWTTKVPDVVDPPYFRFIGGLLLPFVMFFLVYNATRSEGQINTAMLLLTLYGWYALYVAYLQYAGNMGVGWARSLIWPGYINNPDFGIHFDRSRGAFFAAGPQSQLLVMLFFVNLFLVSRKHGIYRVLSAIQAILILPAIFFTGLRAAYVAFLLCGIIWCLRGGAKQLGKLKLSVVVLVIVMAVTVFWSNLTQPDRRTGGVAQMHPIDVRLALTKVTWEIATEHPLVGVGFGHFVEARQEFERDPAIRTLPAAIMQHNVFLNMLAETGIIGLTGLIAIFAMTFAQSLKLYRKLPIGASGLLSRQFVVVFWVVMINYLTGAMFQDTMSDVFSTGMLWSLAGLVVGFNRLLEPHLIDLPISAPVGGEANVVTV